MGHAVTWREVGRVEAGAVGRTEGESVQNEMSCPIRTGHFPSRCPMRHAIAGDSDEGVTPDTSHQPPRVSQIVHPVTGATSAESVLHRQPTPLLAS